MSTIRASRRFPGSATRRRAGAEDEEAGSDGAGMSEVLNQKGGQSGRDGFRIIQVQVMLSGQHNVFDL